MRNKLIIISLAAILAISILVNYFVTPLQRHLYGKWISQESSTNSILKKNYALYLEFKKPNQYSTINLYHQQENGSYQITNDIITMIPDSIIPGGNSTKNFQIVYLGPDSLVLAGRDQTSLIQYHFSKRN